jgi:23S rRNA (adenine2030-N6)-methyltransferase
MNYRHIFHAGNFADCMKHALLIELLAAMQRKDKPFLVLDTHAGTGHYDVQYDASAAKTGEWLTGIARILAARPPALAAYCASIDRLGLYPGSPAIAAAALRPGDRLIACELHPEDAARLRRNFAFTNKANVHIHERDGYGAIRAFLPPPERRALVLIDPPYERPDEFRTAAANLVAAHAKFSSAVYALWYPIKHRAPVREFFETVRLAGIRDVISAEFLRRPPVDPGRLNGCGLLIINPPYEFAATAGPILSALEPILGEPGAASAIDVIADE